VLPCVQQFLAFKFALAGGGCSVAWISTDRRWQLSMFQSLLKTLPYRGLGVGYFDFVLSAWLSIKRVSAGNTLPPYVRIT
jgi:cellulose synthase/poly-beta-1,6-N-acetylglucosamine synthase-like glycosyltransferase